MPFQNEQFDIITMWHVLEHVHLLNETVDWLKERIIEDGSLIIAVPNHESKDAEVYQAQWAAYDVPRHLYHYKKTVIKQFANRYDLKVNAILPMKFDSYYISMLSEKYKKGSIVKAFWNGFISNTEANG